MSAIDSLQAIAERLQGYDPQALSAPHVNAFLAPRHKVRRTSGGFRG